MHRYEHLIQHSRTQSTSTVAEEHSFPAGSSDDEEEPVDTVTQNPLSNDSRSVYARHFQRQQVERAIDKDMSRLWSDDPFFDSEKAREDMKEILMEYCNEESSCEYRQGMHEVLSLVYYTLARDAEVVADIPKLGLADEEEEDQAAALRVICSKSSLVEDSFHVLGRILGQDGLDVELLYRGNEAKSPVSPRGEQRTEVGELANKIQAVLLKEVDAELSKKLADLDIHATSYMIRWLRLLFVREFSFAHCSLVWDAIFAEFCWKVQQGPSTNEEESSLGARGYHLSSSIVPQIAVAMLQFVRRDILDSDFSYAVRRLMRFPPMECPKPLIEKAIDRRHHSDDFGILAAPVGELPLGLANSRQPPPDIVPSDPIAVDHVGAPAVPPGFLPPPAAVNPIKRVAPPPETPAVLRERQIRQGMKLTSIISSLEGKWFLRPDATDEERAKTDEDYVVAVAELKKIRDVLLNNIPEF